jgi:hypothetical protein
MRTENKNFHPREYIENNIRFRILTSSEFIKYKTAQTFILKEIEFNSIYNFSKTAKEIILFKFDVWFDFLCELEQFLLKKEILDSEDIKEIKKLALEREIYIKNVIKKYNNIFDKKFINIWEKIHYDFTNFFDNFLNFKEKISREAYFEKIMNVIILIMQHVLYEIYEIDNLIYKRKLFLSIDEFDKFFINNLCQNCELNSKFCYFSKKLEIYLNEVNTEKILIKNYLSDKCELVDELIKFIKEKYKKNVIVE